MEEEARKDPTPDPVGEALSDTILELQKKYETEKAMREASDARVVELTKVIRTMSTQRVEEDDDEDIAQSEADAIKSLFN